MQVVRRSMPNHEMVMKPLRTRWPIRSLVKSRKHFQKWINNNINAAAKVGGGVVGENAI